MMRWHTYMLPHYDERPIGILIDTIIIHSLWAPSHPKQLEPLACIQALDSAKVSAHYLIDQKGDIWQLVPEIKRAWHAGESKIPFPDDTRENVNHFSIGIELVSKEGERFLDLQYKSLAKLCADIITRYPVKIILGHEHIAPQRKQDPGPTFDWGMFKGKLLVMVGEGAGIRVGA